MKYIVTEATSSLGIELCRYLVSNHQEVYAICDAGTNKSDALPKSELLHTIYLYKVEYSSLNDQISSADVFVNMGGLEITTGKDLSKGELMQTIDTNMDALMAARRIGCSLYVNTGSYEEYGITKEIQDERTLLFPISDFGRASMISGQIASEYCRFAGIKYLHLRLFSIFGNRDYPNSFIANCIKQMQKNEPIDLPSCAQNWNYIYLKDAVKQVGLLMDYAIKKSAFINESFQIASDDTRSLQYFIKELKQILCSSSELNFGSIETENVYSLQPDISKTKETIGFISDYTFEKGIREIIK